MGLKKGLTIIVTLLLLLCSIGWADPGTGTGGGLKPSTGKHAQAKPLFEIARTV